jgi:hypothetical protein
MKNITLAVDEKTLDEVRVYAAKRSTTVNALVRQHLEQLARSEGRARKAIAELRRMSEATEARLGPDYKFDRTAIYER